MCKFKWACNVEENSSAVHSMELPTRHQVASAVWLFSMKALILMQTAEGQPESRIAITLLIGVYRLLSAVSAALT